MKRWKKTFHANVNQKRLGVTILKSEEIYFQLKLATRDLEGHYLVIKRSIHWEYITTVNTYAPNIGASIYLKQILTELSEEIYRNTIVGDFNFLLSHWIDHLDRKQGNSGFE